MKVIYLKASDMNDAIQSYTRTPHVVFLVLIYGILALFLIALAWSLVFKIENTTRLYGSVNAFSQGEYVSSDVQGNVLKVHVKDGDKVKQGDVLYELENTEIKMQLEKEKELLFDFDKRLEAIGVYISFLKGDASSLNSLKSNPYKQEYENKADSLTLTQNVAVERAAHEQNSAQMTGDGYQETIEQNNQKIASLTMLLNSITSRTNMCPAADVYYFNAARSYIATYETQKQNYDGRIEELEQAGSDRGAIQAIEQEKTRVLAALESEQIASVQKEIDSLKDANTTLQNNIDIAYTQVYDAS